MVFGEADAKVLKEVLELDETLAGEIKTIRMIMHLVHWKICMLVRQKKNAKNGGSML